MPLNIRLAGDAVVLSNVARLMNDPRYTSAGGEVGDLIDEGRRQFVLELRDVREVGPPLLGLLMTLTRRVRKAGGEVVLARPSNALAAYVDEMNMDGYWDIFDGVEEALAFFRRD